MTSASEKIATFQGLLAIVDREFARTADPKLTSLKASLRDMIAEAREPRNLADLAVQLDVSEETVRRRIKKRCPDVKDGTRYKVYSGLVEVLR